MLKYQDKHNQVQITKANLYLGRIEQNRLTIKGFQLTEIFAL